MPQQKPVLSRYVLHLNSIRVMLAQPPVIGHFWPHYIRSLIPIQAVEFDT
jgi:hypothetical protein